MNEYRERLDKIDAELFRLFRERMEVVRQIALYKKENGLPVLDAERERQKLAAIDCPYEQKFCEALMALSREAQRSRGSAV
jgi:chorismate mutase/prephenate dehydratase